MKIIFVIIGMFAGFIATVVPIWIYYKINVKNESEDSFPVEGQDH